LARLVEIPTVANGRSRYYGNTQFVPLNCGEAVLGGRMFGLGRKAKKEDEREADNAEDAAADTRVAHEPETHLEQYLAYYVSRREPGYAVLITGDWGTGKTYQVRKALPDDRAHYVSLFGLNTPEELEAQVFAKMFPTKASLKKFADKLSAVNVGLPGYGSLGVNGLPSVLANTFIKNGIDNSTPLIFDDLERCSVENNKILGIINRYVEHHKCRVVVIAHDDKIVAEFKDTKEKVFGQTLLVEPNIDAAFVEFNAFFAGQSEQDKLGDLMNETLSVFRESETSSLRVLRHVVEDVWRLVAVLEKRHLKHRPAMVELIRLFSALAIEIRTNGLDKDSLSKRREAIMLSSIRAAGNNDNQKQSSSFVKAASKYASINLSSTLLNDNVLVETLVEGRFVPNHIRDSVNASAYFLEKEAAPPWQIVGSFDKLDDSVVEQAVKRLDEQFAEREVTDSGEFLHIVALKMMMASKGAATGTVRQVADAAKTYIDDLLKQGRLPPRSAGWMWFGSFEDSHAGVAYWVADTYKAEFKEVFDHLIEARGKALEKTFPDLIPQLLDVVRTDGQKFFEKVCHTRNVTIAYEDIPILAHIPAKDFVDSWLASPRTGWYWIGSALKERSRAAASGNYPSLKPETAWFPEIVRELERRANSDTGLAQLRIVRAAELVSLPPSAARKSGKS
jgi:hypothetical protein